jgi:predicted dehydrogenase
VNSYPLIDFAVSPIETVRIGFIGLGSRGIAALERYTHIEGARIAALCDCNKEAIARISASLDYSKGISEYWGEDAWKRICENPSLDLIYICTDWLSHAEIACYAMECGRHVAVEVPAATSVDDAVRLVQTAEKTRRHCLMLENCIYDVFEDATYNMAKAGLFGDIYHVEGGYIHNLRFQPDWRHAFNQTYKGDNYPTHGLGPICRLLEVNRDDSLYSIVSTAYPTMGGNHTVSLIRTTKGKSIVLQHNIHAARPYSRMYQFNGDKGHASKYPSPVVSLSSDTYLSADEVSALIQKYEPEYASAVRAIMPEGIEERRYMDYAMDYRLIHCLRNGLPLDMSVYDAAIWSCVIELSHQSIVNGSQPVLFPQF